MSDENLIKLTDLVLNAGTQPRAARDEATVSRYAEDMAAGAEFPPIVVFHDGQQHILADGFHRVAAALKAGWHTLPADIRQGDVRDAILYAAGANATHGLPRSSEDVRRAVKRLLLDDEWRGWSNRKLAELAHTSHTTVGRIRQELVEAGEIEEATERTYERDGEIRTMETSAIGTKQRLVLRRQIGGHRLIVCGPDEDGEYVGLHKVQSGGMWKVRSRKLSGDRDVLVQWFEINEKTLEGQQQEATTGTLFQLEPDDMKPPLAGLSWHDDLLQASREAYRLHPDVLACLGKTGIYNIAIGRDAIRLTKALHVRGKFIPCAEGAKPDWLWVIDAATVEELVNDGHSIARLEIDDQAASDLANAVIHDVEMPWEVARREEAAAYARERKEKIGAQAEPTTGTAFQLEEEPTFSLGDRVVNPATGALGTVKRVMAEGQMLNVAWDDRDPSDRSLGLSTAKGLQHADTADVSPTKPNTDGVPAWLSDYRRIVKEDYFIVLFGIGKGQHVYVAFERAAELVAEALRQDVVKVKVGQEQIAAVKVHDLHEPTMERLHDRFGADLMLVTEDIDPALKQFVDNHIPTTAAWQAAEAKPAPTGTPHQLDETPNGDGLPAWVADDGPDAGKPGNGSKPAAVTPDSLLFQLEMIQSGLEALGQSDDPVRAAVYRSIIERLRFWSVAMLQKVLLWLAQSKTWADIKEAVADIDIDDHHAVESALTRLFKQAIDKPAERWAVQR